MSDLIAIGSPATAKPGRIEQIPTGSPPEQPAAPFIVGVGRSGTTLLRLMLDAHPVLAIPPETHVLPIAIHTCLSAPPARVRDTFLHQLTRYERYDDFCIPREALRAYFDSLPADRLDLAVRAFYRIYADRFGKARWGDKTPFYAFHMKRIQEVLPEAAFLHIIRDGRDVYASVKDLWFGKRTAADAAGRWAKTVHWARMQSCDVPRYLEVRYEDLVTDTEAVLRRICRFLALEWSDQMLAYQEGANARLDEIRREIRADDGRRISGERRVSILARAATPPDASRIARWRTVLSRGEVQEYERVSGSLLRELDYPLSAG